MGVTDRQMADTLVTRQELARMARSEGLDVSVRTLRYWSEKGLIEKPIRIPGNGMQGYYPVTTLEDLRRICALRRRSIEEMKSILTQPCRKMRFLEGDKLKEFRVLFTIPMRGREIRFLEDGSFVLVERRKGNGMVQA
jgi:hypothetical protein